jgi:rhodanese-related sulfurtransferase
MPTLAEQVNKPQVLILDVRAPGECACGDGYRGCKNIPIAELPQRIAECGTDKNRPIICYCAAGMRAASAAKILKENGFTDVISTSNANSIRAVKPDY